MEGSDDELPYKPTTSVPRLQRLVLVALATIESLLTSGVIFGWSALLLLLENEGVYAELCPLEKTCAERTTRFELIFTAASTVFALSVWPTGFVLDRFGPRISCCVGSVLFFLGLILFGVSNSRDYDYYLPGFVLIAIGGPPIVFSFMHLSNLFPSRKATIITIFNVMLDASSMDFAAFKVLYEATFVPSRYTFYAYCTVPIFCFFTSVYLAPDAPYEVEEDNAGTGSDNEPPPRVFPEEMTLWNYWDQLTSAAYLMSLLYNCCQLFRVNFYLGSVDYQLRSIADEATAQRWATMFAWILPIGGIMSVPVVGWFLDDMGLLFSMFALNIAATIFGFLICIPVLEVQLLSFILMAFWRAFHFSALSSYVAILFGFRNFGQLWGLSFCVSGVVNIGVYFVAKKVAEDLGGDFFLPNVMQVVVSAALFVFPFWMLWKSRSAAQYIVMEGNSTALDLINDPQLESKLNLQDRKSNPITDW